VGGSTEAYNFLSQLAILHAREWGDACDRLSTISSSKNTTKGESTLESLKCTSLYSS